MDFDAPILTYVGSVDTNSSATGTTKYQILFDASVATVGSVIMFEYKLQASTAYTVPTNVSLNYVTLENAVQTGISNQYILSVPATNTDYDPSTPMTIQFRVYTGLYNSSEVAVTEWSNALDVHVPPKQPVIYYAFYDADSYDLDDLYVLITPDASLNITGDSRVRFIVCYYYDTTSNYGNTAWDVSVPLDASAVTYNGGTYWLVHVPEIGTVSDINQAVYTSVHAVFEFQDGDNNYYSVSEISSTEPAGPAAEFSPRITDISYNVYDAPAPGGNQIMNITWDPPVVSILDAHTVHRYILEYNQDGGDWNVISNNISGDTTTYPYDVSGFICGVALTFRVRAVTTNGSLSQWSNEESKNMFRYSQGVQNLAVLDTGYNAETGNVSMTIEFDNPDNTGCGLGQQFVVQINGINVDTIPYDPDPESEGYSYEYSGVNSQDGTVIVYLQTADTNSPYGLINGAEEDVPYLAVQLDLAQIGYTIYETNDTPSQNILLNWTAPEFTNWVVNNYEVQINNGEDWVTDISTNDLDATFSNEDSSGNLLYTGLLQFRILANMEHSIYHTVYTATSNERTTNVFSYSDAVRNLFINWAVPTDIEELNYMDMNLEFENPNSIGVNGGFAYFQMDIYNNDEELIGRIESITKDADSNGNIVDSEGAELDGTYNITYNPGLGLYTCLLNDIPYSLQGYIEIFSFVQNNNLNNTDITPTPTEPVLTNTNIYDSGNYSTTDIPRFININDTETQVTGNIISFQALKPTGQVFYPTGTLPPVRNIAFNTDDTNTGLAISYDVIEETGVYYYTFTLTKSAFFGAQGLAVPTGFSISAANDAGIGTAHTYWVPPP